MRDGWCLPGVISGHLPSHMAYHHSMQSIVTPLSSQGVISREESPSVPVRPWRPISSQSPVSISPQHSQHSSVLSSPSTHVSSSQVTISSQSVTGIVLTSLYLRMTLSNKYAECESRFPNMIKYNEAQTKAGKTGCNEVPTCLDHNSDPAYFIPLKTGDQMS